MPKGNVYSRRRIVVYEVTEGQYTHTLADEQWDNEKAALADALRHRRPGESVGFDVSLAMRKKAENMGVDIDAPISKKELSTTKPPSPVYDPFKLDRGWKDSEKGWI